MHLSLRRLALLASLLATTVTAADLPRKLPMASGGDASLVGVGWLSTPHSEYNLSLSSDGRLLVFAQSSANFKDSRIMSALLSADGWSKPRLIAFSAEQYNDSDPCLSRDGRWLHFVSNRPRDAAAAPILDFDVWRAPLDAAGNFGPPERLATVNSESSELGPELHDGWLYFNSSRPGGPAKMSIYRAPQNPDGTFGPPEPLAAPFNDGVSQGDFTLSPDGRLAVFWSQRAPDLKNADLFAARRHRTGWSPAVRLHAPFNSPAFDFTPEFSADGRTLYFASMRSPPMPATSDVLNGQANLYAIPTTAVDRALDVALAAKL